MKIITFLFLTLMVCSVNAENIKSFHWVDDEDYPPLIYKGLDGKPAGIFYQIMTKAFKRMNIPLKIDLYPWARAQRIVEEGKGDGMVTVLTGSRKRFLVGSDTLLLVSMHIFVNRNNPHLKEIMSVRSLKSIKKYKIIETIGSGWTKEQFQGTKITWVPRMDNAFKMLIKNRADIFITNGYTGAAFLQKKINDGNAVSEGYKTIITNPYPLQTIAYRLLIRHDSPFVNILDKFNKTINQMKMDGTIKSIIEDTHLSQLNKNPNIK